MNKFDTILPVLTSVTKPAQYIGDEFGVCKKDWAKTDIKIALAYPDIYEIGMSYLGQKILYQLVNNLDYALAERVYAPNIDMEKLMKEKNVPLFSLESKRDLTEFDMLGFSLCYELAYPTMLNMLALGEIPPLRKDRIGKKYPLVCAGGANTFNPEPLVQFIDFFIIGDGEEVIVEISDVLHANKDKSREDKLKALSLLEGVYVPEFYKKGTKIKRRITPELKNEYHPLNFPESYIPAVHDRAVVEVRRGCEHGCRFCQAGMLYRPVRERSKENVLKLIDDSLNKYGYEECSLFSLSTTDYTELANVIPELLDRYSEKGHSFSLPSLRIDNFSLSLAKSLQSIRKSTLTFAVEAGTDRLRKLLNKNINEEQLYNTIFAAFRAGWRKIKLYFIIGLPGETQEDIEEIVNLIKRIKKIGVNLVITCSVFNPKPHTPFQWCRLNTLEEIEEKKQFLLHSLRSKSVKLNFHNYHQTELETLLALGDNSTGDLIYKAWQNGANLDAWDDIFDYSIWQKSMDELGYTSIRNSLNNEKDIDMELPWDFIDPGIDKEFLKNEYKKAFKGEMTPSCSESCSKCGVCDDKVALLFANSKSNLDDQEIKAEGKRPMSIALVRVRTKFTKSGTARFLSHLDMVKLFIKALRRAGIKVAYSEGFNPQPQMQFSPPLSIGTTSECELVDLLLANHYDLEYLRNELNKVLPSSIQLIELGILPLNSPSIFDTMDKAVWEIKLESEGNISEAVAEFLKQREIVVTREKDGRVKTVDIRPYVKKIDVESEGNLYTLTMETFMDKGKTIKLPELFRFFGQCLNVPVNVISIHRMKLE